MSNAQAPPKWNYRRRAVGAVICLSPVGLLVASLVASAEWPRESAVGLGLAVCALLLAALNFYLAVVRPSAYRWRHGSTDGMRNISGIPLVGSLLVVLAGIAGFGDWRVAAIGLFALALDFGGLPWLLIATWRDSGLWDGST